MSFLDIERHVNKYFKRYNVSASGPGKKPAERVRNIEENNKIPGGEVSFFKIRINMESQFYQINILKLLLKWKLHLTIIVVCTVILSAIFSSPFFITPKFKSFGIVYPSNILPYSDESETEQMLQIMQSKDITDKVIQKFDLANHYEIDSSYKYFYTTLMGDYSKNVSIGKTPYEGVMIEVKDKDPQIACDIVNEIIKQYNAKTRALHEDKFGEVVSMYERALVKKRSYIDSLEKSFLELSTKYGLLDYTSQSQEVAKGYLRTIDGSGTHNINTKAVLELKENIEKKGGEFIILENLLAAEAVNYANLKELHEAAYMNYDRQYTYANIITEPFPSDKKSYPVRWLIVVISVLTSFFTAFIIILIMENYKNMMK